MNANIAGACFGAMLCIAPIDAAAQVVLEANGARADDQWGVELGAGVNVGLGGFTLRPGAGVLVFAGENEDFRSETIGNGNTICRDLSNGQFADSERCDNTELRAYARLEASYTFPASAEVGVGARYSGDEIEPYGTISFPVGPRVRIKANGGENYYALGLRLAL